MSGYPRFQDSASRNLDNLANDRLAEPPIPPLLSAGVLTAFQT